VLAVRNVWCVVALAIISLTVASPTIANDDDFKVIVHRDNPLTAIDRGFLRDVFLKKVTQWHHGGTVRPVDLVGGSRVRDRFTLEVLNRMPMQVRCYWTQRIFSGTGVPPIEVESPAAAVAYVLANTGAIAYIPVAVAPGRAKVIPIE
jgi:ABC-type phosphate transport system substrate-binding protein